MGKRDRDRVRRLLRDAHAFDPPEAYLAGWAEGFLDFPGARDRPPSMGYRDWQAEVNDRILRREHKLLLSDLEFLPPEEVADWDFAYGRTRDLVPFAHSARMDVYAWYKPWRSPQPLPSTRDPGDRTPVVFSPREDEAARVFAPNFEGFLFRILLLEYSGSWYWEDFEDEDFATLMRRQAEAVEPLLDPDRARTLLELAARPFPVDEAEGVARCLPLPEAEALARSALDFSRYEETVPHRRPGWPEED